MKIRKHLLYEVLGEMVPTKVKTSGQSGHCDVEKWVGESISCCMGSPKQDNQKRHPSQLPAPSQLKPIPKNRGRYCYNHQMQCQIHAHQGASVGMCGTFFFETWRFPAQNNITNCSPCEVPRRTAAGMKPIQIDHATVNFPGCKALPREAPIA